MIDFVLTLKKDFIINNRIEVFYLALKNFINHLPIDIRIAYSVNRGGYRYPQHQEKLQMLIQSTFILGNHLQMSTALSLGNDTKDKLSSGLHVVIKRIIK